MEPDHELAPTVRQATPEDADELIPLGWELLRYHAALAPEWIRPIHSPERFAEVWRPYLAAFIRAEERLALVAVGGHGVVGYLLAELREVPPLFVGPPELLVAEVAVSPAHRGKGLGKALMSAAYDWGRERGATIERLHVYAANCGAVGFYEHEGFVIHEHVMLKHITGA